MADAFLQIVLEKLSSLMQGEIRLITGVDDEMDKLFSTFTTIQRVLKDAETRQLESSTIQDWLVKLNDLTYEIDDILDECVTEASKLKHKNHKSSRHSLRRILFRRKIGRRMQQVMEKLDAVAAERAKFHLREMEIERRSEFAATRETGSILNESHHVRGREEDREKIVDMLVNNVNNNQEISVQPIIGVGGLGKTTLAQLVFNDQRVVEHFDLRIWVCVSDNFDLKILVKAMIESGTRSTPDLENFDALQRHLWELLNQKRYLLVLDDVWNEHQEKWSELRNILACGSMGSSIIVTTRLRKVADIMRTLPIHYLEGLSEDHCWMLLKERAFGQEKEEYPDLEVIGRQIVKKCAGVPLAAKALGGLLRFKRKEEDWNYVKESEIWDLPQEESLILPALRLSYHHLPLELRQCFAYCAIFPKDSKIMKEELIYHWMAHGYISSKGVLEVEDVGNEICNELILRSLLQDVPDSKETTFTMHDLVHDLALSIMENKIPGIQVQRNVRSASNCKIRQVNLRKKCVAFPLSNQHEMDMSSILKNFSSLRILDASSSPFASCKVKDLPFAVGNLKHLRHLNLSRSEVRNLPNALCSLWNLQVLNLNYCKELVALPKNMRYLINLRHLFLQSCTSLREMPTKIGELTCLRTLSLFIVGSNKGNQLEELQFLNLGGKLKIRHMERVRSPMDAKNANLADKKNLRHLTLEWNSNHASKLGEEDHRDEKVLEALEPHSNLETLKIFGFRGRRFPSWMSNTTLEKIVKINIHNCQKCLHLPQLGELPHLISLSLSNLAVEDIIEDENQGGTRLSIQCYFPSLEELYLVHLPNLKGLLKEQVMGQAFPNLQWLHIRDCSSLILPPLSSLKKLVTLNCSSINLVSLSKLDSLTVLSVAIEESMTCIPIETLQNLTNLKTLCIFEACGELSLPEEGMRSLKSLTTLVIHFSKTLTCLPDGWLQHLATLEELEIISCPQLVELPDGIKYLHNLEDVMFCDVATMVCLPETLQHLSSSLKSLMLLDLPQLNSLPDWLENLTSLQSLDIHDCPKLTSLPSSIQGMANLQSLWVSGCPELERRCERGKGEDWHKISHIPRLCIGEISY